MQAELIIEKNGREALSSVKVDGSRILILTRLETYERQTVVSIHPRPDYSAAQLEYDVDQARHRVAAEMFGAAEVADLLAATTPTTGQAKRVSGPTVQRP